MQPKFYVEIYPVTRAKTRKVMGVDVTGLVGTKTETTGQLAWRAKAKGNHEILASGESYHNRADLMETVYTLFGHDVEIRNRAILGSEIATGTINADKITAGKIGGQS